MPKADGDATPLIRGTPVGKKGKAIDVYEFGRRNHRTIWDGTVIPYKPFQNPL
jgi:hypothetical protein